GENGRYRVPSVLVVGAERAAVGASPTLAGQPLPHTGQRLVGMQGKIAAYVIGASGFPRSQAACQHERLRAGPSACFRRLPGNGLSFVELCELGCKKGSHPVNTQRMFVFAEVPARVG